MLGQCKKIKAGLRALAAALLIRVLFFNVRAAEQITDAANNISWEIAQSGAFFPVIATSIIIILLVAYIIFIMRLTSDVY